ncbi:MAG: Hsp20/alpha crystallin family protein [Gammaproteobacteria bacterium]
MILTRYEPWSLFNQVQSDRYRLLESRFSNPVVGVDCSNVATSSWTPAVDLKEEETRFVLYADLPGIDPADMEITMEQGILAIKGERHAHPETEGQAYKRVERPYGTFYRRFSLPDSANGEAVQASGKNGVLEISIPKHEKAQPRKIAVRH